MDALSLDKLCPPGFPFVVCICVDFSTDLLWIMFALRQKTEGELGKKKTSTKFTLPVPKCTES